MPLSWPRGLVRCFGQESVVADVVLSVAPGKTYGCLGPNGTGKTTAVKMLVTLLAPSAKRAEAAGYDISREPGEMWSRIRLS